jgi:hypothetical protein
VIMHLFDVFQVLQRRSGFATSITRYIYMFIIQTHMYNLLINYEKIFMESMLQGIVVQGMY